MMKPNPENAAFLAIDIAKRRNEVLLETPDTGRRRRMTVLNTQQFSNLTVAVATVLLRQTN